MSIDPTALFKMYKGGFRASKSPPIDNALGSFHAFVSILMHVGSIATLFKKKIDVMSLVSFLEEYDIFHPLKLIFDVYIRVRFTHS